MVTEDEELVISRKNKYKIGIVGTGIMANNMAKVLTLLIDSGIIDQGCKYAVASRSQSKADEFISKWGFLKAYGSYDELFEDPCVDIVYIATTNNTHFEIIKCALLHHKPVLCEKPFTLNYAEAKEVIEIARENNVFVSEAMWTRYMPITHRLIALIKEGIIGDVSSFSAKIQYNIIDNVRIRNTFLGGGALLDLGVYCVDYALMILGDCINRIEATCKRGLTGVDISDDITLFYQDNTVAMLKCSVVDNGNNQAVIQGTNGSIVIDDINCPMALTIFKDGGRRKEIHRESSYICGYEYELFECFEALRMKRIETNSQRHQDILSKAIIMDRIESAFKTKNN